MTLLICSFFRTFVTAKFDSPHVSMDPSILHVFSLCLSWTLLDLDLVGYEGRLCSVDIDECTIDNPCMNSGNCSNTAGGYTCLCADGEYILRNFTHVYVLMASTYFIGLIVQFQACQNLIGPFPGNVTFFWLPIFHYMTSSYHSIIFPSPSRYQILLLRISRKRAFIAFKVPPPSAAYESIVCTFLHNNHLNLSPFDLFKFD